MDEYITKEQAMELACRACEYTCYGEWERCGVKEWVDDIPPADVQPVVHGEWVKAERQGITVYGNAFAQCSICGKRVYMGWDMKYCPECGARMD